MVRCGQKVGDGRSGLAQQLGAQKPKRRLGKENRAAANKEKPAE